MTLADLYLQATINRHLPLETRLPQIQALRSWPHKFSLHLSGSHAKETALRDSDVDYFLDVSSPLPIDVIQRKLAEHLHGQIRNVSVRVIVENRSIDLVPACNNTLWQFRHNMYLKTDISEQRRVILHSGLQNEIRALKLWRRRHALRFPSFLLELSVLQTSCCSTLSESFLTILHYLSTTFPTATIPDPANQENIVSDLLTPQEKSRIALTAAHSLRAKSWPEIL